LRYTNRKSKVEKIGRSLSSERSSRVEVTRAKTPKDGHFDTRANTSMLEMY